MSLFALPPCYLNIEIVGWKCTDLFPEFGMRLSRTKIK